MNRQCQFDPSARRYLNRFYCIFHRMMCEMNGAVLTDSISHNFIVQMIPHHRAAIEMSKNILDYTKNSSLERIAGNIIKEQTKSIENMQEILPCCSQMKNCPQELGRYQGNMNKIMSRMFYEMNCAYTTNQINCDFIREMIPHHEGAVKMSENTLEFPICPELIPILNSIIRSQERGIREMQDLLKCIC